MAFGNSQKIKLMLAFNHIAVIVGLCFASASWYWLVLVGWILINRVGGEIGLHRYFCHRSFEPSKVKRYALFFLACLNCVGSPLMWVGVHRKHHAKSDTAEDPHGLQSPLKVWSTFWDPYTIETKYLIDMMKDPIHRWVHKHYFSIIIVTYVLLGLIAWEIPVFLISASSLITLHSAGLVNTICHKWGYRNFDTKDQSTNNTLINIITLGSGLHNNHHAKPNDYSNAINDNEYDFAGWLIKKLFL